MVIQILHLIGMARGVKYILDFSVALGGFTDLVYYLSHEASTIRIEALYTKSVGTQLTYFGWMIIWG